MATYCRMTSDGLTVTEVVKVRDEDNLKNGVENEGVGITFLTNLYNWSHWRKTSKSTGAGKHWTKDADGVTTETPDQSKAYRFNFGNPGSIYDEARDMFRKPNAPYPSWSLNESTGPDVQGHGDSASVSMLNSDPLQIFGESASNWATLAFSDATNSLRGM